ncbi:exosortase Y-associated Wzy-like protein [Daejeonella oryzae]|uniref:exosortase Y-associated Wzy-like protein n=1 Tax=Daejeonella oryzae TaxID=1122943 RepID=UPI0003FD5D54|nr:hypothetical protein [Daejeonella oryzae]
MNSSIRPERYLLLYIPWLISLLLTDNAILSYFTAWLGSFFIFTITIKGLIKPIPADLKFSEQLMRPLFLPHIIFAGYMSCTSIFYFLSVLGYVYFEAPNYNYLIDQEQLNLVAQCQRYYSLAHATFVAGILVHMDYSQKPKYYLNIKDSASFLLISALVLLPVSALFLLVPGLSQFYFQFQALSFMAGTLAFAFAIPLQKPANTILSAVLFFTNVSQALLSGFKEPIIISFLVLGIFLYPFYKKLVLISFLPLIFVLFILLPTYSRVFRANAWAGEETAENASEIALDAVFNQSEEEADESNWAFLTNRLSEINMFSIYVGSTPSKVDYYGFEIIKQAAVVIIPRFFWPGKPIPEEMVMERVYNAGVVNRGSNVSAKPPIIVDAYLSGGNIGIVITLFIYGSVMQLISMKAEKLFGGYIIGTAFIFSGLFEIMWRGNSFEFLSNSVLWSFITMIVIFYALRYYKIIKEI